MALDSLRRTIESERVLFAPGSADVPPETEARVRHLANLISQVDRGVADFGGAVRLELTGRTDPTGLDEKGHSCHRCRSHRSCRQTDGRRSAIREANVAQLTSGLLQHPQLIK